jgi:hypothetical protein
MRKHEHLPKLAMLPAEAASNLQLLVLLHAIGHRSGSCGLLLLPHLRHGGLRGFAS